MCTEGFCIHGRSCPQGGKCKEVGCRFGHDHPAVQGHKPQKVRRAKRREAGEKRFEAQAADPLDSLAESFQGRTVVDDDVILALTPEEWLRPNAEQLALDVVGCEAYRGVSSEMSCLHWLDCSVDGKGTDNVTDWLCSTKQSSEFPSSEDHTPGVAFVEAWY